MSPRSQPMSPGSPSAADAAAAALAAAADHSGGGAGALRQELVPLPDQLQEAVEAAMASGACCAGARAVLMGGATLAQMRLLPFPVVYICAQAAWSLLLLCKVPACLTPCCGPRPGCAPAEQLRPDSEFCSEKYRAMVRGFLEKQVRSQPARRRAGGRCSVPLHVWRRQQDELSVCCACLVAQTCCLPLAGGGGACGA